MAEYECLGCGRKFEAPWGDEAWLLAVGCSCGSVAVASRKYSYEDGCMSVEDVS